MLFSLYLIFFLYRISFFYLTCFFVTHFFCISYVFFVSYMFFLYLNFFFGYHTFFLCISYVFLGISKVFSLYLKVGIRYWLCMWKSIFLEYKQTHFSICNIYRHHFASQRKMHKSHFVAAVKARFIPLCALFVANLQIWQQSFTFTCRSVAFHLIFFTNVAFYLRDGFTSRKYFEFQHRGRSLAYFETQNQNEKVTLEWFPLYLFLLTEKTLRSITRYVLSVIKIFECFEYK